MKSKDRNKISEVLERRAPKLKAVLASTTDVLRIDHETRTEIASALNDEFVEFGLQQNDEPNRYGLEIEALIDSLKLTSS